MAEGAYEAPLGPVETALAQIWSEVLGVERVGRRDSFFALGGHSLLAIKVLERMRRAGLQSDVRALFATPVLCDLAAVVGKEAGLVEVPANRIAIGCERITPDLLPLIDAEPGSDRRDCGESARGLVQCSGHLSAGAFAGRDPVPSSDGGGGGSLSSVEPDELCRPGQAGRVCDSTEWGDRPARYFAHGGCVGGSAGSRFRWYGARHLCRWKRYCLIPEEGDAAGQLKRRFDPRHYRLDVRRRRCCGCSSPMIPSRTAG